MHGSDALPMQELIVTQGRDATARMKPINEWWLTEV